MSLNSYVVCLTLLLSLLFDHGVGSFAPANKDALKTAVDACISETGDGSCPIFATSNDATGNPYDVMGEWDRCLRIVMKSIISIALQHCNDLKISRSAIPEGSVW